MENKISKPGFETSIRIVVVSPDQQSANAHLTNITSVFSQFAGEMNGLKSRKVRRKGAFVEDFISKTPAKNAG